MIIGRNKEIEILNSICDKPKSSFVSIYGRRRIGKTYLVDQFFKNHRKDAIFFDLYGVNSKKALYICTRFGRQSEYKKETFIDILERQRVEL